MKTPNKPLFIIYTEQTHGRGAETQWVSCTSSSCPFVASVVVVDQDEYSRHYDPSDDHTVYSEPQNRENLRTDPTNPTHRMIFGLLKKMHEDYEQTN